MTLATQITKVRALIEDQSSTLHSDAQFIQLYDMAVQGFLHPYLITRGSQYARKNGSITLVNGTETYDLAADCLNPIEFWLSGNDYPMLHIPRAEDRIKWSGTGGKPDRYYLLGNKVGFRDSVPGTGTVYYDYWFSPTEFTATTATMPYGDRLNAIINQTVIMLVQNMDEAQIDVETNFVSMMEGKFASWIGNAGIDPDETRNALEFDYEDF